MKDKILNYFKPRKSSVTYYNEITRLKSPYKSSIANTKKPNEIISFMFNQSITASSDK